MKREIGRRGFLGAAGFTLVPRHVLGGAGYTAPSDKLTLASIGMGRQGMVVTMDLLARPDTRVVAVCDCNRGSLDYAEYGNNALLNAARRLLGPGHENWGADLASPGRVQLTHSNSTSLGMGGREPAKRLVEAYYRGGPYNAYADFRELLDKEKDLDAVYVATPDHWHAPIAIAAMRKRKHVLGQKPMAHSIGEARRMAQTAREMGVATSLTVNDPMTPQTRQIAEWISAGAIGKVREVHNWSRRPYWPQGVERPEGEMPVPPNLDWDMWLGPAPARPYHKAYLPFVWRGWYDFGCGALGDMGCYSFAGIMKALDLGPPTAVEASSTAVYAETYPQASTVHFDFAGLRLSWYDGGLRPPRPGLLPPGAPFGNNGEGVLYIGDKGIIVGGFNGQGAAIYPESQMKKYAQPKAAGQERGRDFAIDSWIRAAKGGPAAPSSFENQRAVTETILMGNLALRAKGEKVFYDRLPAQMVDPPYRGEWAR